MQQCGTRFENTELFWKIKWHIHLKDNDEKQILFQRKQEQTALL